MKQKVIELKGKIDKSMIFGMGAPTFSLSINRTSRQKIIEVAIENLNSTINPLDLIEINRTFHPTSRITSFANAHGT